MTYIHIPGYGWWYAVTMIDYYSRYLLACHLTHSYSAVEAAFALKLAREETERIHGPLNKPPFLVTDNGSSFIAKRFVKFVSQQYSHVRIRYRTPTQLGLLERFHQTLKTEECTGSCTITLNTLELVWPNSGSGIIIDVLIGPWCPKKAAILWFPKKYTATVAAPGFPSGKAGPARQRRNSTTCWRRPHDEAANRSGETV